MRHAGLLIAVSLLAVAPLAAQEKGTFEIGGFGRWTSYPDAYQLHKTADGSKVDGNQFGGGGRLGYFVAKNWAVELDGSFNPTDLAGHQANVPSTEFASSVPLNYTPFHLQAVYNAPLSESGAVRWMIGAGPGYTALDKGISDGWVSVGAMTGFRFRLAQWLNLRVEGTADFLPTGYNDSSNVYLGVQAGASWMLGGCNHTKDMIGINPTSANLGPRGTQQFKSDAWFCGKADMVTYTTSGPGTVDPKTGLYTSGADGCATVTATSTKGKLVSTANVCTKTPPPVVVAPPPPPPPPVAAPVKPKYTFQMASVNFKFDHSDLTKGGMDTLNTVAATLKANPGVNVDVIGHTDWVGTNAYNMKLSQARAETVKKYLASQGVAADRIMVKWRGEEEPAATNDTAAGRATNRRGEIKQNN